MRKKKLYCYTTTVALGIILGFFLVGMLVPVILYPKEAWFLIIGIFLLLLAIWYLIGTGMFFPIYLTENGMIYRKKEYNWEDIKITAYPALHRSQQYGYYLVFGEKYLFGKELKAKIRTGFWVYLKEKPLEEILKYYKRRIVVLDAMGNDEDDIRSTKKINAIINEQNKANIVTGSA